MLKTDKNARQLSLFDPEVTYSDTPLIKWLNKQEKEKAWLKGMPFTKDDFLGKEILTGGVYYYYLCENTPLEKKQRLVKLFENLIRKHFDNFAKEEFGRTLRVGREYNIEPSTSTIIVNLTPDIRKMIGLQDFPESVIYYSILLTTIVNVFLTQENKPIIRYELWNQNLNLDGGVMIPKHPTDGIEFKSEL